MQTIKLYDIRVKPAAQGSGAVPTINTGSTMVSSTSKPLAAKLWNMHAYQQCKWYTLALVSHCSASVTL